MKFTSGYGIMSKYPPVPKMGFYSSKLNSYIIFFRKVVYVLDESGSLFSLENLNENPLKTQVFIFDQNKTGLD